jgi:hypothetical protein
MWSKGIDDEGTGAMHELNAIEECWETMEQEIGGRSSGGAA